MPIYDYECRSCGHRVEVIHGVNASGPTACERCGGPMRKMLTTPSIVFKGSGWAKKDARDARPTARTSSAGSEKSEGGSADKPAGDASGDAAKDAPGKGEAGASRSGEKPDGKSEGKSEGRSEGKSEGKSEKAKGAD